MDKFEILLKVARAFEEANIFYVLSSGTLLGAVREGGIIESDYDFDIDAKSEDEVRILSLNNKLASFNILLKKEMTNPIDVSNGKKMSNIFVDRCLLRVTYDNEVIGDIFLFTCFSDGILRRFDLNTNFYSNPRHQHPAWFWEKLERYKIYDEDFWAPRFPEVLLQSMYGDTWNVPIAPNESGPDNHPNGAIHRRKTQSMILFALKQGWESDYSKCVNWPIIVKYVNSNLAREYLCWSEPEVFLSPNAKDLCPNYRNAEFSNSLTTFQYEKIADLKGIENAQLSFESNQRILNLPTLREYRKILKEKELLLQKLNKYKKNWENLKNNPFLYISKTFWKKIKRKIRPSR